MRRHGHRRPLKTGRKATGYNQTRRRLVLYFGATRPLDRITAGDADDWRQWLASDQQLGDNTIAKTCSLAKQFLRDAKRRKVIADNPFEEMKHLTVQENRDRDFFVTRVTAEAVLDACPDAERRLIFALSRFGGLRCPSEHLRIRWQDVGFARGKLRSLPRDEATQRQGNSRRAHLLRTAAIPRGCLRAGRRKARFTLLPDTGRRMQTYGRSLNGLLAMPG